MTAEGLLPTVSVVVPVRDGTEGLAECLACLDAQTYPRDLVQVVVADSASRGPVAPALLRYRGDVALVRVEQPGSYLARNEALRRATGEVVAFTDADCLPDEAWLERGVAVLRTGVDRVAGRVEVVPRDPDRLTSVDLYELLFAFPQEQYATRANWAVTANLLTTRAVLDAVGPFDEALASGGDIEWGQRAGAAGFSLRYDAGTLVRHPSRRTFRALAHKRRRTLRGNAELAASGRLDWAPGYRMYLRLDRPRLGIAWRAPGLSVAQRLRVWTVIWFENLVAAAELARFRWERR